MTPRQRCGRFKQRARYALRHIACFKRRACASRELTECTGACFEAHPFLRNTAGTCFGLDQASIKRTQKTSLSSSPLDQTALLTSIKHRENELGKHHFHLAGSVKLHFWPRSKDQKMNSENITFVERARSNCTFGI